MKSLVLNNVDDQVFEMLKTNAAFHGVSPEEEALSVLEQNLSPLQINKKTKAREFLHKFREQYAPLQKTDSVQLIREDRDR